MIGGMEAGLLAPGSQTSYVSATGRPWREYPLISGAKSHLGGQSVDGQRPPLLALQAAEMSRLIKLENQKTSLGLAAADA